MAVTVYDGGLVFLHVGAQLDRQSAHGGRFCYWDGPALEIFPRQHKFLSGQPKTIL